MVDLGFKVREMAAKILLSPNIDKLKSNERHMLNDIVDGKLNASSLGPVEVYLFKSASLVTDNMISAGFFGELDALLGAEIDKYGSTTDEEEKVVRDKDGGSTTVNWKIAPPPRGMSTERLLMGVDEFLTQCYDTMRSKNEQYNDGKMALRDVYDMAETFNMTPTQVMLVFMSKHWEAIRQMSKRKDGKDVSDLDSRLRDLSIYCGMIYAERHRDEVGSE